MAFPDILVEADFTTPPLIIPSDWTDLSSRARGETIRQGRQQLLDRTEAGHAVVRLDNLDRGLDPTLHPEVKPWNHLRISAVVDGAPIRLFRGFVRSWPQEWPEFKDAVSEVQAEDAFALMARYELEGQSVGELSTGDHLESVLTTFGWPAAGEVPPGVTWWRLGTVGASELGTSTILGESLRFLDEGTATIMALDLEGNLLDHLLNVAERTEGGFLFIGPDGDVVFTQKPTAFAPSAGTWGDSDGEHRYRDLIVRYDDTHIYNDVRVTRRGESTPSVAKDQDAIDAGAPPSTLSLDDVLFSTTNQAANRATELLNRFKEPQVHPVQLVMRPKPDAPWADLLGMRIGTKINVIRRPPGGGDPMQLDALVIGVTYDISPEFWEIAWDLAPAEKILQAWYLGRAGFSELGRTTILA